MILHEQILFFAVVESQDLAFVAAYFNCIDSSFAVESYEGIESFTDFKQAYLMKTGLLQSLQNMVKCVDQVARSVSVPIRVGRLEGMANVLMTRHIVAGHPLGGKVRGQSWQHFQDRASVDNPKLIKVMSFNSKKPEEWTGKTIQVVDLIDLTHQGINQVLSNVKEDLEKNPKLAIVERPTGVLWRACQV